MQEFKSLILRRAFFWHGDTESGIQKTQCYPSERSYPALIANTTTHDPLIVQGQYAWSANISHGLFDVISDFLILRNYARIKSIKSKPALPALIQLLSLLDIKTDESSVMASSNKDDMTQDKALS